MNRTLLKRWVGEGSWLLLPSGLALFAFCWLRVWVIGQIEMGSFQVILEQVWDKYEKYSPVPLSQLLTYHGRVAMAFSEPLVVLVLAVWAIARGSDVVSGQLGRGVMEMLLAQPIRRWELILSQSLVTVLGIVLLCVCIWSGVAMGIHTTQVKEEIRPTLTVPFLAWRVPMPFSEPELTEVPMSERTSAQYFIHPTLNLFSLTFFLAGLATFLSSWDRYRWRTIGLISGFVVVQMMMRILSLASEPLNWLAYFTFFTAYEPEVMVRLAVEAPDQLVHLVLRDDQGNFAGMGPLGFHLLLLVPGALGFALGTWVFCRRDLPAPL
jgi:ABC-2 type transport system permease protein